MKLMLHDGIDVAAAAAAYVRDGHVRVQPFLSEASAIACLAEMKRRDDWVQVVNSGDKVFELSRSARDAMNQAQRDGLDQAVLAGARAGFQYRYEALRLPDGDAPPPAGENSLIATSPAFLSGGAVRDVMRAITGADDIGFADGQATAYAPGDFLTGHDDAVPGKHRRAAYVFSLNPVWRVEWGRLLLFHAGAGVRGVGPAFNSLDIFAVPQMHSVSMVTGSVPNRRYSITGWLRAKL
ncbi:MAG: 2OG-Fe(II) oxygenase [Sandarakinorhabdus sp.]